MGNKPLGSNRQVSNQEIEKVSGDRPVAETINTAYIPNNANCLRSCK